MSSIRLRELEYTANYIISSLQRECLHPEGAPGFWIERFEAWERELRRHASRTNCHTKAAALDLLRERMCQKTARVTWAALEPVSH